MIIADGEPWNLSVAVGERCKIRLCTWPPDAGAAEKMLRQFLGTVETTLTSDDFASLGSLGEWVVVASAACLCSQSRLVVSSCQSPVDQAAISINLFGVC